jgi:hypothetical protein
MPFILQICSTLTAFTKFLLIALVFIKAYVLIFNLLIIHITIKGVFKFKLKLKVKVVIYAIITPLRTSYLKITLFLKGERYLCLLYKLKITL